MSWRTCSTTGLRAYGQKSHAYRKAKGEFLKSGDGWTAWACRECGLWHAQPVR